MKTTSKYEWLFQKWAKQPGQSTKFPDQWSKEIEMGLLIDVSNYATQFEFKVPVAIDKSAFEAIMEIPKNDIRDDANCRIRQLLNLLWHKVGRRNGDFYTIFWLVLSDDIGRVTHVELKAICNKLEFNSRAIKVMLACEF